MAEKKPAGPSVETAESLYDKAMEKLESDPLIVYDTYRIDNFNLAASMFEQLGDYRDAPKQAQLCRSMALKAADEAEEKKYQNALRRMKAAETTDQMEKVQEQLEELDGYKDSAVLLADVRKTVKKGNTRSAVRRGVLFSLIAAFLVFIVVSWYTGFFRYLMGKVYLMSGSYDNARAAFERLDGFLDSSALAVKAKHTELLEAETGDVVPFGNYKWKVLERDGSFMTMIAASLTEESEFYQVAFSDADPSCGWEDSSLRAWLNGEIYENGFSDEEREMIQLQETAETVNTKYGTAQAPSSDWLTLLSAEDCPRYQEALDTLSLDYYLRTPGEDQTKQAYISGGFHQAMLDGCTKDTMMAVRPVIRVDISGLKGEE